MGSEEYGEGILKSPMSLLDTCSSSLRDMLTSWPGECQRMLLLDGGEHWRIVTMLCSIFTWITVKP